MNTYTSIVRALIVVGVCALALPLMAATTASISPSQVSTVVGKTFSVTIVVNPQGANNYAEKLQINFPAGVVEVQSFTFANNWIALTQPGYDSTDNSNGSLIKTGGYPGGFSGAATFGTVTFYTKKAGSGTITIGNNSLAFEVQSQSAITGNGTVVNAITSAPASVPVKKPTIIKVDTPSVVETSTTVVTTTTPPATTTIKPTSNETAAVTAGSPSYVWFWIVLLLLVVAGIGYWTFRRNKKN